MASLHTSEDVSQAYKLYITICLLLVVLFATTAVRVWTRLYHRRTFTTDDGLIVLGTCFNIIADGMELFAVRKGFGRHTEYLGIDSLVMALKYMQLGVLMATIAIWSIKVSVCFFLLGLLRDVHKRFRLFIWVLMAFTTLSTFIGLLLWGLQAHPLERLWDPRVKGTRKSSHDFLTVVYIFYAFNLFTDIIYSLTPIWFLWNVQISKTKKHAIWVLMGSGLLLTVVVIMCIVFAPEFLETENITWALVPLFITDCIQRHLSGVVANLPALYTLFSKVSNAEPSSASSRKSSSFLKRLQTRSRSSKQIAARSNTETITLENVHKSGPYSLMAETDDNLPLRA